ncbi:MAG: DUF1553 domain-containing protein [Pirellulaceae bacterium]|nr:DUF1553 domain-containing protein [Pirellulaceae bacterium]
MSSYRTRASVTINKTVNSMTISLAQVLALVVRLVPLALPGLAAVAWCGVASGETPAEPTAEQVRFFESEVRPLLVERCYKCHGQEKQKGDLRLDSLASILQGGESGPAIAPGDADGSLLVEAVRYESFEMPPDGKLADEQIAVLARWVEMGAPWPGGAAAAPPTRQEARITDADRAFWSFQPLVRHEPPQVDRAEWSANPIDRFLYQRLLAEGLEPAARADRRTLVRRATFDLLGLPPTADEVRQFVDDPSPDAYAELIERLLSRPEYGERWARHWLDLVRYAESDGFRQDAYRPDAWRYRDYVIRSLNQDKPYDRFVQEQLAGDELWPGEPEAMVATALLRHGIYEYNQRDVRTQWSDMLNDITDVTADVFLGLGMGCARCHDHKFDPILQEDYYRLQAFFTPLLPRDDLPLAAPDEVARYHAALVEWERQTAELRQQIAELEADVRAAAADSAINKFPQDIRPMLRKAPPEREPFEQQLAALANRQVVLEYQNLKVDSKLKGEQKARWEELQKQLAEFDHLKPQPLPAAFTVTDVGPAAPPTRIPGKRNSPDVPPGFLSVLDPSPAEIPDSLPNSQTTGRRAALVMWLTRPDHPLTTRVIVNRVWQQHFGQGLVATPSDFGRLGEPPSHPELLDWLATEFVARGWSFKQLHRLIMTSAAYQQSSLGEMSEAARLKDPENRLLWRMSPRRLEAEQIRDALLAASGELDRREGGPSAESDVPRRTVYTKIFRNTRDPLLAAFDAPDAFASLPKRNVTTTPTQSLLMINGAWGLQRAAAMARAVQQDSTTAAQQVQSAFWRAYSRPATDEELARALDFLAQQQQVAAEVGPRANLVPGTAIPALDLTPGHPRHLARIQQGLKSADSPLTIEAVVLLRSMYPDAAVRTIVAQWNGNQQSAGWSLGVTSTKSAYRPRNLILQLVGPDAMGKTTYEVVPSNLHLELNTPYYVAAVIRPADASAGGITFHVRQLNSDGVLQTAQAAHKVLSPNNPDVALTVGGRYGLSQHQWDGLIGALRVSAALLAPDQLLNGGQLLDGGPLLEGGQLLDGGRSAKGDQLVHGGGEQTVGHWTFADGTDLLRDSGPRGNHLVRPAGTAPDQALVDLCHALLNSSEFLYVD